MSGIRFDHIAIAVERIADARPALEGALGGASAYGGFSTAYSFHQWRFEGGGRLEILEPRGPDGFLRRFLRDRGAGIHHVTFLVPSLDDTCARARARGYDIVGHDASTRDWKEAFLHPRQALGIVVQLAETRANAGSPISRRTSGPPRSRAVRILGLKMRARSWERARRQWSEVLGGQSEESPSGEMIFCWPESPLRLAVAADPTSPEGAVCIEYESEQPVKPHSFLGASFVRSPAAEG